MSCCTCGNNCQSGYGCLYQVILPDNPVSFYSAANINTQGIGVYDSTEGTEFDFRGIVSGNSSIVVTLNASDNTIVLTLNVDQIIDDLPQATTVQRGVGMTSTDAGAIAKANTQTFLTPKNLAALGSSTTFAGLVELATSVETIAGTDATRAVTPDGLQAKVDTLSIPIVFADAATRAGTVPAFKGQFGGQQSNGSAWVSFGLAAGDWNPVLTLNTDNDATTLPTTVEFTNGSFDFNGGGTGFLNMVDLRLTMPVGTLINWTGAIWQNVGVTVPANSVFITNAVAGTPSSALRTSFVSTFATNTGWTAFTNSAVLKTGDCNALTLPQLCQIVDTLIGTLRGVLLPAL